MWGSVQSSSLAVNNTSSEVTSTTNVSLMSSSAAPSDNSATVTKRPAIRQTNEMKLGPKVSKRTEHMLRDSQTLGYNVPIFCPGFLTAFSIQENEEAFVEFFTLFDPYVAIILGDNKAVQSPLCLNEIFQFFATAPMTQIACPQNLQYKTPDPSAFIEEAYSSE
ncbi:hypothetical protein BYT27DRAFT_7210285 [Phlegmacium glaucopus]|nr:hypothetical protein BYT27DRAFT_7210285 [Phlegmacium glaucopus]